MTFLGQNVRKYGNKLLIKPSVKNYHNCIEKIRNLIKDNKTAKQETLIQLLNPIIRGWSQFHCAVVAKEIFASFDYDVWRALWHWTKRRHPNKSGRWIREKYFHVNKNRTWEFGVKLQKLKTDGTPYLLALRRATDMRIIRHLKIRSDANPYAKEWESYFKKRYQHKKLTTNRSLMNNLGFQL